MPLGDPWDNPWPTQQLGKMTLGPPILPKGLPLYLPREPRQWRDIDDPRASSRAQPTVVEHRAWTLHAASTEQ